MGPIYACLLTTGVVSGITAGECGVVKSNLIIKCGKEIVYGLLQSKRYA